MAVINPFSTRFVRPGAQPFLYPPGWNGDRVTQLLRNNQWRGEIVGPHGSGKSTLIHDIIPCLRQQDRRVIHVTLSSDNNRCAESELAYESWDRSTQLVIDGYEQLGWWQRWRIQRKCRRAGSGLLITAHRPMGLPTIWTAEPELKTVQQLVSDLLGNSTGVKIGDDVVRDRYQRHGGNIRELLFDLYDIYERRTRSGK